MVMMLFEVVIPFSGTKISQIIDKSEEMFEYSHSLLSLVEYTSKWQFYSCFIFVFNDFNQQHLLWHRHWRVFFSIFFFVIDVNHICLFVFLYEKAFYCVVVTKKENYVSGKWSKGNVADLLRYLINSFKLSLSNGVTHW